MILYLSLLETPGRVKTLHRGLHHKIYTVLEQGFENVLYNQSVSP